MILLNWSGQPISLLLRFFIEPIRPGIHPTRTIKKTPRWRGLEFLIFWFQPEYSQLADILPARILVFPGRLTGTVGNGLSRNGGKNWLDDANIDTGWGLVNRWGKIFLSPFWVMFRSNTLIFETFFVALCVLCPFVVTNIILNSNCEIVEQFSYHKGTKDI